MQLKTHISTSILISLLVDKYLEKLVDGYSGNVLIRIVLIAVCGVILQVFLDVFGHTYRKIGAEVVPVRNKAHSLPAIILISLVVSAIPIVFFKSIYVVLMPLLSLLLHYVEDLATESGVYLVKKRVRLGRRIRYDDPFLNKITTLVILVFFIFNYNILETPLFMYISCIAIGYSIYVFVTA